jgi:hypothetical protein
MPVCGGTCVFQFRCARNLLPLDKPLVSFVPDMRRKVPRSSCKVVVKPIPSKFKYDYLSCNSPATDFAIRQPILQLLRAMTRSSELSGRSIEFRTGNKENVSKF